MDKLLERLEAAIEKMLADLEAQPIRASIKCRASGIANNGPFP